MYKITIFNAKKDSYKIAYSQYDDNTFIFQTAQSNSNIQLFNTMVSNWTLNIPLNISEPIRTFRRRENLDKYYENVNYFILDIDKVNSKEHKDFILDFFKDYRCIIGESKSYNGVNNFNMKGILFTETVDINNAKACISNLNHSLKDYCDLDEAVSRKSTFNAPIGKNVILLNNESSNLFKCQLKTKMTEIKDGFVQISKNDKVKLKLDDVNGDTLEEYCVNIFKAMGFEAMNANSNGSISFKHPSEEKSKGGYFWFKESPYTMHHPNSVRTINIFEAVKKTEIGKQLMKVELDYNDAFLNFNTNTKIISCNEKYLTVDGKTEEILKFINDKDGLLSIKSPMGTGKSTIINYIVEESHNNDMRVLIITNRISVANDFNKKYNIKLYNKHQYNLGDSLIVQFDSLWKYDIKQFDIVIMDEFISLMMHSRNNLSNSSLNIAKFFGAFNKKLVIADAFLTGYENFLLQHKKTNVVQINNTYRDQTTLYNYEDKNYFIRTILKTAKSKKCTISGTSLVFLNSIKALLEKNGLKVILLTSDTPDSTKELVYGLFELEEHDKWDVFMYSPTLTVGVSNLNNVYEHFHYDSSMSTDVISSIQMIKRTRKAKNIHMFISDKVKYLKITYNDLRDDYMGNIGKYIDQNYMFDVDDYGEAKLSSIGRNAIKIDTFKNIIEFNHKEGMLWMLNYHFAYKPRIITDKFDENIIGHYSKILKDDKHVSLQSSINDFLMLNNIQKTNILLDNNKDNYHKLLKSLIEIDMHINADVNDIVRTNIINISLKNSDFVKQCLFYKHTINFVQGIYNIDDIKVKVSNAVIRNSDNLVFYNILLKYGQVPFNRWYQNKPKDKLLLYILEKIGYKIGTLEKITSVKDIDLMSEFEKQEYLQKSNKVFRLNPDILEYYGYIKE